MKKMTALVFIVAGVFLVTGNVMAAPSLTEIMDDGNSYDGWMETGWDSLPDGSYQYELVLEDASYADSNSFGTTDGAEIFSGPDAVVTTASGGAGPFYLDSSEGSGSGTGGYFTSDSVGDDDDFDHFLIFKNPNAPGSGYYIAMEDLLDGGDEDYDDMVVHATPIPGAVWLFASGLVGLVGYRKKVKK